jgi:alpha-glucosidase
MTREGVMGNEYNKWSTRVTPEYTTTTPFTRMLCGPIDFTPGGFLNSAKGQFTTEGPTRVQGTRSHQLAMFVVYDSPICTVADHPDNYKGQTGVELLKTVPAVWDDTKVLDGKVGEYIVMARRSGEKWFIGAMTNSQERELTIKLDFLKEGSYTMTLFRDTDESATDGMAVAKETSEVKAGQSYTIHMAPGGGFAAWLVPMGD